jgi:hypothetical protein
VKTGHHGFLSVVGESFYQDALRRLAGGIASNGIFTARLVPEPTNPHDPNAVAVCAEGTDLERVGYLSRKVARQYQPRLIRHGLPVRCPAKLNSGSAGIIGVVLDFEEVRDALGLPRVSVDQGGMDYEALHEYHRLNRANREFVKDTIKLERSDPAEAVTRYRKAIAALRHCRDFASEKGIDVFGIVLNQTDATAIDRLTRCLMKMNQEAEAVRELEQFVEAFPQAREMTLIKAARERVARAPRRS